MEKTGNVMLEFAKLLFPICRSITGNGTRTSLNLIKKFVPNLNLYEVPTGTKAFDWIVPKEWNINDAYLLDPDGRKVISFKDNNLHVLNYSVPVDTILPLDELQRHLYSLPDQPTAIPYITSYYAPRWGFCLSENQRKSLKPGNYRAVIDSTLENGSLTYGELLIPGKVDREVLLSTYVCHPSMANNELSGPVVLTEIAKMLCSTATLKYSYRLLFLPETIGSLVYLSRNLKVMKERTIAGLTVTCIGDERAYSYLESRLGNTLSDRAAKSVLKNLAPNYLSYSFLERGSDERQYCAPGVDLPIASIMRSKYGVYPEYHTSLDNFDLVTAKGLAGGYRAISDFIEVIEKNETLNSTVLCEPQLGPRGLYPTISTKSQYESTKIMMDLLAYCDGTRDLLEIAEKIQHPVQKLFSIVETLKYHRLLATV